MISIVIVLAASAFQVGRNAAQRGLMGDAGPWGATLVRFLFGLPFAVLLAVVVWLIAPNPRLYPSAAFWTYALSGSVFQVLATAALLSAMRRSGFAVGTTWQQSALPFTAIVGLLIFNDRLTVVGWLGIALVTGGLAAMAMPEMKREADGGRARLVGVIFGLVSGLCFSIAFNSYRHANLTLAPGQPVLGATVTVAITQAVQSVVLAGLLAWRRPSALRAVLAGWRTSLTAGFCGAAASALWLTALGITPAAVVRAVGMAEAPMAALAGRRLFAERLTALQWIAGAAIAAGVALTAFG